MILGKDECEKAANALELSDQSAYVGQEKGIPYGCTYVDTGSGWLMFYPPEAPPYPPVDCGSKLDNGTKYDCICSKGGNM